MRRTAIAAALLLAAALLGGCDSGAGEPAVLPVITPPASATAAAPTTTGNPASTSASAPTSAPVPTASGVPTPASQAEAYQGMVRDWQTARGAFFAAVSDGRPRTAAQQRALAAALLAGERAFAARVRAADWPDGVRRPVAALLAQNRGQQTRIAAMARAGTSGQFTSGLADYGTGTAAENAAVTALTSALG
jgi:hypothetical protein